MNSLFIKNYTTPIFLVLLTPIFIFCLLLNTNTIIDNSIIYNAPINTISLTILGSFIIYGIGSIKLSNKYFLGQVNIDGIEPYYAANGFEFWLLTMGLLFGITYFIPTISLIFTQNFIQFIFTSNIFGLYLVIYLIWRDYDIYFDKKEDDKLGYNILFKFYRGLVFHPKIGDIDIKQFTNCRFGMISWQIIIFLFAHYYFYNIKYSYEVLVSIILQTIYIGKFFYWETGYFNTLDITLDRGGYYICWGCLVFLPAFYTYAVFNLINTYEFQNNFVFNTFLLILGVYSIYNNYIVDQQKEDFKRNKTLYKSLDVIYKDNNGVEINSKLLIDGYWGKVRHMNYMYEIITAICWCLPGYNFNKPSLSILYVLFLVVLLIHRIFRDEKKCSKKYGIFWDKYCSIAKYRLVNYIF